LGYEPVGGCNSVVEGLVSRERFALLVAQGELRRAEHVPRPCFRRSKDIPLRQVRGTVTNVAANGSRGAKPARTGRGLSAIGRQHAQHSQARGYVVPDTRLPADLAGLEGVSRCPRHYGLAPDLQVLLQRPGPV